MRIFLFIYTLFVLAGSALTLRLVPRALRDLGRERQKLKESYPEARFEQMVEAGYRMNILLLLAEILYYYLLLAYTDRWQLFWGAAAFGLIHIVYLVVGRFERNRLKRTGDGTGAARLFIWLTAVLTSVEIVFLAGVLYVLLI
ncbi:MAG: hypothetical protein IBX61_01755 [Thermoleophilia bacterium]|nr:hypothetical protein [Thermoleophilia bacterium]